MKMRTPLAALGLALALFLVVIGISGLFVWQGYRDTLNRGEQRAATAAETIAAHFRWIIEASRQALSRIDDTIGFRPELLTVAEVGDMDSAIAGLPSNVEVRVFDRTGRDLLSTAPDEGKVEIEDRDYFQALRDGQPFVISGMLVDRGTNQQSFVIGRRLVRNGEFAGIAAIIIPSDLIADFWASLNLGRGSVASIIGDDGWIVTRFPPLEDPVNLAGHELFTRYLAATPSGSYRSQASPADGAARLVGYHRVDGAPLIALAAVSTDAVLEEFRTRMTRIGLGAIPIFLGLAGFAGWVFHLLASDSRRREELEDALAQNRLLLREVHHRVKNNLQTVTSLIRLQPLPPDSKRDLAGRIAAMAAVHEQIYRSDRLENIKLDQYVRNIADSVRSAFDGATRMDFAMEPLTIDPERAMVIGLIVTEIISNSMKHAFPGTVGGTISVELGLDGEEIRLAVRDDGVGFGDPQDQKGLGMRLIDSFVRQLDGTYRLTGDGGLAFELRFPAEQQQGGARSEY